MIIGHNLENGRTINIDVQRVVEGRLLFQANSGGGKSYALRKFCEVTHGKVQQIILDVEGEFASLREKFDYILVGKDGDIPVNLRASELLAKRLLELNTSAIIDLYELKHHERKRFVRNFLDSLINSPKELWHPCLVIIDECHIFAPEKTSGESESLDSVKDLATRGRKRGFALVAATQRLSKLNKDVVAELNTKLIGRSSLDVDMKRAAFELGFTDKKDILSLRSMNKGEFYAFGPALTNEVTKIKVDKVLTTHPEAGKTYQKTKSAPAEKVKRVLEKLKDLPVEAEEELKTQEDLKRKIIELKREIGTLKRAKTTQQIDKNLLKEQYERGFKDATKQRNDKLPTIINSINNEIKIIDSLKRQFEPNLKKTIENLSYILGSVESLKQVSTPKISNPVPKQARKILPGAGIVSSADIQRGQQMQNEFEKVDTELIGAGPMKILNAIAQFDPNPISIYQTGTFAGYSVGSGTWTNYISILKKNYLINKSGKMLSLTDQGRELTKGIEPLPTDPDSLLSIWKDKLPAGPAKILQVLFDSYPDSVERTELAERSGYAYGSGTWTNYISILRRNHLIEDDAGNYKVTKTLFPLQ